MSSIASNWIPYELELPIDQFVWLLESLKTPLGFVSVAEELV